MRTFVATEFFELKGRGRVWIGPSPIQFARDTGYVSLLGEWIIEHPEAEPGRIYNATAVESHCVHTIRKGAPIGLLTPL